MNKEERKQYNLIIDAIRRLQSSVTIKGKFLAKVKDQLYKEKISYDGCIFPDEFTLRF